MCNAFGKSKGTSKDLSLIHAREDKVHFRRICENNFDENMKLLKPIETYKLDYIYLNICIPLEIFYTFSIATISVEILFSAN